MAGNNSSRPAGGPPGQRTTSDVVYDWNLIGRAGDENSRRVTLYDETLRDGIQSPSVTDPAIDDKIEILHTMEALGIDYLDMGLPGAGKRAQDDCLVLAKELVGNKLRIKPSCAARTMAHDVLPIVEISQQAGVAVEVMAFIGSSPIRQFAENWDVDFLKRKAEEAITLGVKHNLPVTFVTEDTTRSHRDTLEALFRHAIGLGAKRLCLCDTVGHATPGGVSNLIKFTRQVIASTGEEIGIDWHGHNDRGLALPLALHAAECGADRVHGTCLGVGERVGNTPIDQLLVNYKLLGVIAHDLTKLVDYCRLVSRACRVPIPFNYPVAGRDAFRTGTGVHAAAIIKAEKKGDAWLADRIYSGVPAGDFGKKQEIEIGHYSGLSNVTYWLKSRGIDGAGGLADAIFEQAKVSDHVFSEAEVMGLIEEFRKKPRTAAKG